jgi:hypothetical protein
MLFLSESVERDYRRPPFHARVARATVCFYFVTADFSWVDFASAKARTKNESRITSRIARSGMTTLSAAQSRCADHVLHQQNQSAGNEKHGSVTIMAPMWPEARWIERLN